MTIYTLPIGVAQNRGLTTIVPGRLVPVGDVAAVATAIEQSFSQRPTADFLRQAAATYETENSTNAYLKAMGLE